MATLVIWFLQTFNTHLSIVTDSKDSILAMLASVVAPIFKPMGFGDWRISTALITGFMAKESVVSTLSILFGNTAALLDQALMEKDGYDGNCQGRAPSEQEDAT